MRPVSRYLSITCPTSSLDSLSSPNPPHPDHLQDLHYARMIIIHYHFYQNGIQTVIKQMMNPMKPREEARIIKISIEPRLRKLPVLQREKNYRNNWEKITWIWPIFRLFPLDRKYLFALLDAGARFFITAAATDRDSTVISFVGLVHTRCVWKLDQAKHQKKRETINNKN